jgi:hypothetical protein
MMTVGFGTYDAGPLSVTMSADQDPLVVVVRL